MPEIDPEDSSRGVSAADTGFSDALAWVEERWVLVAGLVLFLVVIWFASAEPRKNGRYLLVKDDVPCESRKDDEEGRRWCYLVLDTQSGLIEERIRKVRAH